MGVQRSVPGFAVLKTLLTAADALWDRAALARWYMSCSDGAVAGGGSEAVHRPLPTHGRTLFCLGTAYALLAAAGYAPEPSSSFAAPTTAAAGAGGEGDAEATQQRAAARLLLGLDVEDVLRPMEVGAYFAVEVGDALPASLSLPSLSPLSLSLFLSFFLSLSLPPSIPSPSRWVTLSLSLSLSLPLPLAFPLHA